MTSTQQRVLTFIKGYHAVYRMSPTLVEIGEACGLSSTGAVRYVLDALEVQGKISRRPKIARSIVVVDAWPASKFTPLTSIIDPNDVVEDR